MTLEIRKSKVEELKEKRRQGFLAYFSGCRLVVKNHRETSDYERALATNKATGRESMMQAREVRSSVQSAGAQESDHRSPAFSSVVQGNNTEAVGCSDTTPIREATNP